MNVCAQSIADALAGIALEHGLPNGAKLDEVAGPHRRLSVAHVLLWHLPEVNAALATHGVVARYHPSTRNSPAHIELEAIR